MGADVLQLHLDLGLRSRGLEHWPVQGGQQLAGSSRYQTGLPVASLGGGGEGSLPAHPPHSSEDIDDAGELPPAVVVLHTGGGGAMR